MVARALGVVARAWYTVGLSLRTTRTTPIAPPILLLTLLPLVLC